MRHHCRAPTHLCQREVTALRDHKRRQVLAALLHRRGQVQVGRQRVSALRWCRQESVPSVQECAPLCPSIVPHSFTPTAQH